MDTLFTVPPVLTERQQAAADYVAAQQHPVLARELGRHLHLLRGCRFCSDSAGCRYAESEGLSVLKALKPKGVVRLTRRGWLATRPAASSQGGLPDGF